MSALYNQCCSVASWLVPLTIGNIAGDSLVKVLVPQPACDWTGTQATQPSTYKKIALIAAQVLLTIAAPMVLTGTAPFCVHLLHKHVPFRQAIAYCIEGGLFACATHLGENLIKRANGNWTPDQHARTNVVLAIKVMSCVLPFFGVGLYTSLLVPTVVTMIYDLNPEKANRFFGPILQKIEDAWNALVADLNEAMQDPAVA